MHAIWKGSISFGLVGIPIALFSATRREELKFKLLRRSDMSPINYKRVAEADGKEVPWDQIVKGYEYEKGKYVVLKDEDFKRVDVEATQTVDIIDFVELPQIDPIFFSKPYYMVPTKGGEKAYVLLRDVLKAEEKVGIAKVVIKTRQHLASVKPRGRSLILELMHFADEITPADEFKIPGDLAVGKKEKDMAKTLVASMTDKWDPKKYKDDYREGLMKLIRRKVAAGGKELPEKVAKRGRASNVIDLAEVLQQSIRETRRGTERRRAKTAARVRTKTSRKATA